MEIIKEQLQILLFEEKWIISSDILPLRLGKSISIAMENMTESPKKSVI